MTICIHHHPVYTLKIFAHNFQYLHLSIVGCKNICKNVKEKKLVPFNCKKGKVKTLIFNNINELSKMSDHWSVKYWYLLFFAVLTNGFYPTGVSFICTIDIPPPPFHISRPLSWDRSFKINLKTFMKSVSKWPKSPWKKISSLSHQPPSLLGSLLQSTTLPFWTSRSASSWYKRSINGNQSKYEWNEK